MCLLRAEADYRIIAMICKTARTMETDKRNSEQLCRAMRRSGYSDNAWTVEFIKTEHENENGRCTASSLVEYLDEQMRTVRRRRRLRNRTTVVQQSGSQYW